MAVFTFIKFAPLVLALGLAGPRMHLGVMKLEKSSQSGKQFRLYIQGKRMDLVMQTSLDSEVAPDLSISRTPSGVIYGTVAHTESGAYLQTLSNAFVLSGGRFWEHDETQVAKGKGNTFLVVPVQMGPWAEEGNAFLFSKGAMKDVGYATEAFMKADGSVAGWYYSNGDHTPFKGLVNEAQAPVYKQYFEWAKGVRTLKGRQPA